MNEVTKLYENAGLSNVWVERYNDGYYEHERYYNSYKEMINNMMKANDWTLTEAQEVAKRECKKECPPFTAEKQLELIKWLCTNTYRNYLLIRYNFTNYYWQIECNMTDSNKLDNFAETIASMINNLWQSLTEEERKQIKEILE